MPQVQAERQLLALEASLLPHLKDKVRDRIMGRWTRKARNERPQTASEALATLPIPVIYEPAKGGDT